MGRIRDAVAIWVLLASPEMKEKTVAVGIVFFVLRVSSLLTIKNVLLLLMCRRNEVFAVIWAAAGLRIAQIEPFCSVFMSVGISDHV